MMQKLKNYGDLHHHILSDALYYVLQINALSFVAIFQRICEIMEGA